MNKLILLSAIIALTQSFSAHAHGQLDCKRTYGSETTDFYGYVVDQWVGIRLEQQDGEVVWTHPFKYLKSRQSDRRVKYEEICESVKEAFLRREL